MIEKSADPIDLASQQEAIFNANALQTVQKLLQPQLHPDFNGLNCLDCNDEIPPKRLEFGRIRCTSCEELLEENDRRMTRRKS
jgi:RNA polymerase-binding transcription factor DksA